MRITGRQLRRIIKEEILREVDDSFNDIVAAIRSGDRGMITSIDPGTYLDEAKKEFEREMEVSISKANNIAMYLVFAAEGGPGTDEDLIMKMIKRIDSIPLLYAVDSALRSASNSGLSGLLGFLNGELHMMRGISVFSDAGIMSAIIDHLNRLAREEFNPGVSINLRFSLYNSDIVAMSKDSRPLEVLPPFEQILSVSDY